MEILAHWTSFHTANQLVIHRCCTKINARIGAKNVFSIRLPIARGKRNPFTVSLKKGQPKSEKSYGRYFGTRQQIGLNVPSRRALIVQSSVAVVESEDVRLFGTFPLSQIQVSSRAQVSRSITTSSGPVQRARKPRRTDALGSVHTLESPVRVGSSTRRVCKLCYCSFRRSQRQSPLRSRRP